MKKIKFKKYPKRKTRFIVFSPSNITHVNGQNIINDFTHFLSLNKIKYIRIPSTNYIYLTKERFNLHKNLIFLVYGSILKKDESYKIPNNVAATSVVIKVYKFYVNAI